MYDPILSDKIRERSPRHSLAGFPRHRHLGMQRVATASLVQLNRLNERLPSRQFGRIPEDGLGMYILRQFRNGQRREQIVGMVPRWERRRSDLNVKRRRLWPRS